MDKYEFNLKIEQLRKLIDREDYATSLRIVQTIDWNRVRNTNLLTTAATVYEKNDMLQEAKDLLILAFERAPVGKHLLFKLTELSCRTGDLDEAEDYYHEFRAVDSTDISNYVLQYMILKARKAPFERQVLPLERYCELDPDEKWLYELATVYEYSNRIEDCVRVCDRLALLYGTSTYGIKAVRLKSRYAQLTDVQYNMLRQDIDNTPHKEEPAREEQSGYLHSYDEDESPRRASRQEADPDDETAVRRSGDDEERGSRQQEKHKSAGIYDDRDFGNAATVGKPVYIRPEEEAAEEVPEEDFRKSDALAAERYADEDAVFDAYVRAYASDEGRPAAASVEVINGTASVQEKADEGDGVQMAFDFGSGEPKFVEEEYAPETEPQEAVSVQPEDMQIRQTVPIMQSTPVNVPLTKPEITEKPIPADSALETKTAEAPAAAASETVRTPAAATDTASAEQSKPKQQIKETRENASGSSLHMIVEAETEADGLSIAVDELKNLHEEKKIDHASIKTSADKLNQNGITEAILDKVRGKDFVIEHAGALSRANIETVYNFICSDKTGTIVVLIDTPEGLDRIEEIKPQLFDICDYISDVDDAEEAQPKAEPAKPAQTAELSAAAAETRNVKAEPAPVPETAYEEDDDEPYDEAYEDDDESYDGHDEDEPEENETEEKRTPVKRSNGKVSTERFYNVKEITPERADHQMEIDEFAQYCAQYAASIDCSITGTSMLALYERIELMEENDIPLTKTNAEQLIEEAADRAEKPPIGKRLAGMFKSKYDKNGLLILKEDDFIY